MSKKGFGKFITLAAIAGAAAAGISYLAKYKSFSKELDEDFHDFVDNNDDDVIPDSTMSRNYVSFNADKDELLVAAGDMLDAAKDVALAAKNVIRDAAAIFTENAQEVVNSTAQTVAGAKNQVRDAAGETGAQEGGIYEPPTNDTVEAVQEAVPEAAQTVISEAVHETAQTVVSETVHETAGDIVRKAARETSASAFTTIVEEIEDDF